MAPGVAAVPLFEQTSDGIRARHAGLVGRRGRRAVIACANVANLMLARAAARRERNRVRLSLGAGRWRVMRQLLTESIVLARSGAGVGTLFGYWGVESVRRCKSRQHSPACGSVARRRAVVFTVGGGPVERA